MSTKVIFMNTKSKVWEETVVIPTYEAAEPDRNPLFLEKRVYQGSSGKVYPHPVIDKISDEKIDKEYEKQASLSVYEVARLIRQGQKRTEKKTI